MSRTTNANKRQISFRTVLTLLAVSVVGAFFFVSLAVQSYAAYRSVANDRALYQRTISDLLWDSIRQPLIQGSFLEAKARLQVSLDKGDFDCVDLQLGTFVYQDCKKGVDRHLRWHDMNLKSIGELKGYNGHLQIGFDDSIPLQRFWHQMFLAILFSLLGSLGVLLLVRLAFRTLDFDMTQLMYGLRSESQSGRFRTLEFQAVFLKLQELLQTRTQLVESEAFSGLAKSVVHDIRSPLSVMKIIAAKDIGAPEISSLLKNATDRLEGIANHLLNYGNGSITRASVSAQEISSDVKQLLDEYRHRTRQCKFSLNENIENAPALKVVRGDLLSIVDNLVKNSTESIYSDGVVNITLQGDGERLIIQIDDNGQGISDEVLKSLGHRPITAGKSGGTGFGLYFSLQKIKQWGGSLHFERLTPQGTRATLLLPIILNV